jgi:hypothetical protein
MGRHDLAGVELDISEESLVSLDEAALDQGFGKAHDGEGSDGGPAS